MVELFLLPVQSPALLGIYGDKNHLHTYHLEGKLAEALPQGIEEILKNFPRVDALYYVRGPGSFTAIKLSYIFFKTLSLTWEIPLWGASCFDLNPAATIKAHGNTYFIYEEGTILTRVFPTPPPTTHLSLPQRLDSLPFSQEDAPLYVLPAL